MIIGIGTDIIEIERIGKIAANEKFMTKHFTEDENLFFNLSYNQRKIETIAGSFAAKEAVAKSFGTGFRGFGPIDIEILHDEYGKPFVKLYNNALKHAHDLSLMTIHLSISHCTLYAVAYCIAER